MTYQNLIFEKKEAIGYLTLNRPQKLNSFSTELMAELGQALMRLRPMTISGS